MGKAFQAQLDVSVSSKEKALWESQSGVVTETKTMAGFPKGLSTAVAISKLFPFMEGNKSSSMMLQGTNSALVQTGKGSS